MPFPSDSQPDTELFDLIDAETKRQVTGLQLIASENFTSPAVMRAVGSVLTNKYAEGYPGKRYYGGNAVIDDVEALAIDRAKRLFGADHANVLSIGARVVGVGLAEEILATFLATDFEGGRHARRVEQVMNIEAEESRMEQ